MNLYKIYNDICNRGHERGTKRCKGYELHHIIPKSYFKSRKIASYNENLALLTPKEHFVVHHILSKVSNDDKMIFAFYKMSNSKDQYDNKLTLKEYENIKTENYKKLSIRFKGRVLSKEWKHKLSIAKIGKPTWNKGLTLTNTQKINHVGFKKGSIPWNKKIAFQ
jgi:hypothetical protein